MNEFVDPAPRRADNPQRPRWRARSSPVDPDLPYPLWLQAQPSRFPWFSVDESVQARLVWSGWPVEIQGVRLRNVNTQAESTVRPTGRLVADVRRAFAQVLAEQIVAAVWPAPVTGMSSPASSAELLDVAEEALDPGLLAVEVVRVTVQIAAVHAGIPPVVARVMGQAAGDLFTELSSPDPDAGKVQAVQYVDLALSAADGSLINSPTLPQIVTEETANVIDELLGPKVPASPVRKPDSRASTSPEPTGPVSDPVDAPIRRQLGSATNSDPVPSPRSSPSPFDMGGP